MEKSQIVERLREIAQYLDLDDASPFEVNAFRNAAEELHYWDGDLEQTVADGTLTEIYAIGKGIAGVIAQYVHEGRSDKYDSVKGAYPDSLLELFSVPGLGMKKVKVLYGELGIASLDALEQAARDGAVRSLQGFGAKSEERLMRAIAWARKQRDETPD